MAVATDKDLPKIPKGIAMMIRQLLGVDPEMLFSQFQEATKTMMDFCRHFDGRMVALTNEVTELKGLIADLRLRLENPAIEIKIEESINGRRYSPNVADAATTDADAANAASVNT